MKCADHGPRQGFWVLQVGINNRKLGLRLVDKSLKQHLIFERNGSSFDIRVFNPCSLCYLNIGRLNIGHFNIGRLNIGLAEAHHLNIQRICIKVVDS